MHKRQIMLRGIPFHDTMVGFCQVRNCIHRDRQAFGTGSLVWPATCRDTVSDVQDNPRKRQLQLYQYTRINIIEHPVKLNMLGTWAEKANLKPSQCRDVSACLRNIQL